MANDVFKTTCFADQFITYAYYYVVWLRKIWTVLAVYRLLCVTSRCRDCSLWPDNIHDWPNNGAALNCLFVVKKVVCACVRARARVCVGMPPVHPYSILNKPTAGCIIQSNGLALHNNEMCWNSVSPDSLNSKLRLTTKKTIKFPLSTVALYIQLVS
jgi:hypothetical protein